MNIILPFSLLLICLRFYIVSTVQDDDSTSSTSPIAPTQSPECAALVSFNPESDNGVAGIGCSKDQDACSEDDVNEGDQPAPKKHFVVPHIESPVVAISNKYAYSKACLSPNRKRLRNGIDKEVLVISQDGISRDTELDGQKRRRTSVKSHKMQKPDANFDGCFTTKTTEKAATATNKDHEESERSSEVSVLFCVIWFL